MFDMGCLPVEDTHTPTPLLPRMMRGGILMRAG